MFTWLNKKGVRSTKGFELHCTGRFSYEYKEGSYTLQIDREAIATPNSKFKFTSIVGRKNFNKWDDGTPISPEKQEEIIKNVTDALEFQGMGLIVDPDIDYAEAAKNFTVHQFYKK